MLPLDDEEKEQIWKERDEKQMTDTTPVKTEILLHSLISKGLLKAKIDKQNTNVIF